MTLPAQTNYLDWGQNGSNWLSRASQGFRLNQEMMNRSRSATSTSKIRNCSKPALREGTLICTHFWTEPMIFSYRLASSSPSRVITNSYLLKSSKSPLLWASFSKFLKTGTTLWKIHKEAKREKLMLQTGSVLLALSILSQETLSRRAKSKAQSWSLTRKAK